MCGRFLYFIQLFCSTVIFENMNFKIFLNCNTIHLMKEKTTVEI